MPQSFYGSQRNYRRRQNLKRALVLAAAVAAGIGVFALLNGKGGTGRAQKRQIEEAWQSADYAAVYSLTAAELEKSPVDYFLLTANGFAAYQIAIAQINASDTGRFIDACIWSLRKAGLHKEAKKDARVSYVLGKAYYYKGLPFMDLAVAYLEEAQAANYGASDIDEYLGLCYAALKDYENSVAAFSRALKPVENEERLAGSDIFLLAIARSYFHLGELSSAKAYSTRALEVSRDYKTVVSARLLLGNILAAEDEFSAAEAQYLTILKETGENADAHFYLGEVYAEAGTKSGDIKARAEWRKALRIDPAYAPARERLHI